MAVFMAVVFLATTYDSASFTLASVSTRELRAGDNPARWLRVFWAVALGAVASILLIAGGLDALQTAAITGALPFAVIMLIAMSGLWRALIIEGYRERSLTHYMSSANGKEGTPFWRERLRLLVGFPKENEVAEFIRTTALNSLKQVQRGLQDKGWHADVEFDENDCRALLSVTKENEMDFAYEVRLRGYTKPSFAYPEIARDSEQQYYRAEVFLKKGGQSYDVFGYEEEDIINDLLDQFEKYLHFLHTSPGILPWQGEEHQRDAVEKGDQA